MSEVIEAVGLGKTFRTAAGELEVLKGIDVTLHDGEMVGITGASGAGKSTLMHILGALDRPSAGKVFYRGRDVFSMDEASRARFRNQSIGFVFQFHHLLPEFTAIENVMLPALISGTSYAVAEQKARGLINDLGLTSRLLHRPGELSGGEQQRAAVARALIQDPTVVLADEPTGNLDTATGNSLFELFLALNRDKGITFIIVTHNTTLADRCQRILRMADGRFI